MDEREELEVQEKAIFARKKEIIEKMVEVIPNLNRGSTPVEIHQMGERYLLPLIKNLNDLITKQIGCLKVEYGFFIHKREVKLKSSTKTQLLNKKIRKILLNDLVFLRKQHYQVKSIESFLKSITMGSFYRGRKPTLDEAKQTVDLMSRYISGKRASLVNRLWNTVWGDEYKTSLLEEIKVEEKFLIERLKDEKLKRLLLHGE